MKNIIYEGKIVAALDKSTCILGKTFRLPFPNQTNYNLILTEVRFIVDRFQSYSNQYSNMSVSNVNHIQDSSEVSIQVGRFRSFREFIKFPEVSQIIRVWLKFHRLIRRLWIWYSTSRFKVYIRKQPHPLKSLICIKRLQPVTTDSERNCSGSRRWID